MSYIKEIVEAMPEETKKEMLAELKAKLEPEPKTQEATKEELDALIGKLMK